MSIRARRENPNNGEVFRASYNIFTDLQKDAEAHIEKCLRNLRDFYNDGADMETEERALKGIMYAVHKLSMTVEKRAELLPLLAPYHKKRRVRPHVGENAHTGGESALKGMRLEDQSLRYKDIIELDKSELSYMIWWHRTIVLTMRRIDYVPGDKGGLLNEFVFQIDSFPYEGNYPPAQKLLNELRAALRMDGYDSDPLGTDKKPIGTPRDESTGRARILQIAGNHEADMIESHSGRKPNDQEILEILALSKKLGTIRTEGYEVGVVIRDILKGRTTLLQRWVMDTLPPAMKEAAWEVYDYLQQAHTDVEEIMSELRGYESIESLFVKSRYSKGEGGSGRERIDEESDSEWEDCLGSDDGEGAKNIHLCKDSCVVWKRADDIDH
jgi:hypothetical protein